MKRLRTWIFPPDHSIIHVLIVSMYDEKIEDEHKGYCEVVAYDPQTFYNRKKIIERIAIKDEKEYFDNHDKLVNIYLKMVMQNV